MKLPIPNIPRLLPLRGPGTLLTFRQCACLANGRAVDDGRKFSKGEVTPRKIAALTKCGVASWRRLPVVDLGHRTKRVRLEEWIKFVEVRTEI